jgi:hypothetical protein
VCCIKKGGLFDKGAFSFIKKIIFIVNKMSIATLPGLSLSLKRHNSVKSSESTSVTNNINVNLDSVKKASKRSISRSPKPPGRPATPSKLANSEELELEPFPQETPKDRVSLEFMKALIRIQTELLLDSISLMNNLKEFGNKVIYRDHDLKELISILMGIPEDEIQVNTEELKKVGCCTVPVYVKIKTITLRKTIPFIHTEIGTRLQEEFKISLEFCIPDLL